MIRFGWKRADMVGVYAHLSARDVDDKELRLHGLKESGEADEPLIEIRQCPNCQAENAPVAMYCQKCGAVLGLRDEKVTRQAIQEEVRRILREQGPELLKELAKET
jgi:ribosomal protein L40E